MRFKEVFGAILIVCTFICTTNFTYSQSKTPIRTASSIQLNASLKPFYHGVASGDPIADAVIIWTRVTPDSNFTGAVVVSWSLASDTGMTQIVQNGSMITDASRDYTVHVDVTGLQPDSYYYYEFSALGKCSVRGRTKTAPQGDADSLRFALISCASFESGFFNAYASITEHNDIDAVIHLGDYIYEYESGGYGFNPATGRLSEPANEIISLADYRTRFSHYHLDKDLRNLHQQYPFMVIWDDHETADNAWRNGAGNHDPATEGPWPIRKSAAIQAYNEWLPLRYRDPLHKDEIFRKVQYGDLCELFFLDTRLHGRDQQMGTTGTQVNSPSRTLLGADQFEWFTDALKSSQAQWKVITQQVMIAPLKIAGIAVNEDQWDGYPAERRKIFDTISTHNISNIVVLTGDIHTSWANDIPDSNYNASTGAGSLGVEFVAPGVTSPSELTTGAPIILAANEHIKYVNLSENGYVIMDVNKTRTQADWYYVVTLDSSNSTALPAQSLFVNDGDGFLSSGGAVSVANAELLSAIQAPAGIRSCIQVVGSEDLSNASVILGVYPNPIDDHFTVHYYMEQAQEVQVSLFALDGREIFRTSIGRQNPGLHRSRFSVDEDLTGGLYILEIKTGTGKTHAKVLIQ
ncbi:MAG: alkaline phosphatase D family protein [Flavobacteriales bacterium]|nr:alkaline phosphatase D family protein [Flavobacteriales bacterium]